MKVFMWLGLGIGMGIWLSAICRAAMEAARREQRDRRSRMRGRVGEI